jgi:glycosyltransferase involved in cell wall biosynthesis
MKLAVVSHKYCWTSIASQTGYATDGGFPFQISALKELCDELRLLVPCSKGDGTVGEIPLGGPGIKIVPLTPPRGRGIWRKVAFLLWTAQSSTVLIREIRNVDAVHAPIPGDVGTMGMIIAFALRKPLFVRHCGNWFVQTTRAEHFWKWFMEKFAGGRNVMLATGGDVEPPSRSNPNVRWIFATSLTRDELRACNTSRPRSPLDSPRLIIVCRQDKEKGTGTLLQSLPNMINRFPEISLDVVGDGEDLPKFKTLTKELGLDSHVIFHGKVDHSRVLDLLKRADLFCYPTTASEGFPKVVLEALACGLPVITTRVSVLPELIGTGCGVLLDEVTPEALATATCDVLSNETRYRALSTQAVSTAENYSLEHWRDAIGDLLRANWTLLQWPAKT